jgi:hypothetical protein
MRKGLTCLLFGVAILSSAPAKQTFVGSITDSECAKGDHSSMRMGPNDAECTIACIRFHDAAYVLWDGKTTLKLSDQKTPEKFAGQKVKIVGVLDPKTQTIQVESITSTSPKK